MDKLLQNKLQQNRNSVDWVLEAVGRGASIANELLVVSLTIFQGEMPSEVNGQMVPTSEPPPIVVNNRPVRQIRSVEAIQLRSDGLQYQENKAEVIETLPVEKELSTAAANYKGQTDLPNPMTGPPEVLWSMRQVHPSSNDASPTKAKCQRNFMNNRYT